MRLTSWFGLLALSLICPLLAAPAQAQRARVFVASFGSDSNPCSFTQPCRTFQVAVGAVLPGGEVTAIDSAGFGAIIINKAVTISSPLGVEASIAATAGGTSIQISAGPNDTVNLRGLTLEGAATGQTGVVFGSGGALDIDNCIIRNFTDTGVLVEPGATALTNVLITNSRISGNPNVGINIRPLGGIVNATLDHLAVFKNGFGISLGGNPGTSGGGVVVATVSNSTVTLNGTTGITAASAPGGDTISFTQAFVRDTVIASGFNASVAVSGTGIAASGADSFVIISHVSAAQNAAGVSISGGATVSSAGNNDLANNTTPVSGGSLTPATEQ